MAKQTIIEDPFRLTATTKYITVEQGENHEHYIEVMKIARGSREQIVSLLRECFLFVERIAYEERRLPLPEHVAAASERIPSYESLREKTHAEIQNGDFKALFLPYSDDEDGSTAFALNVAQFPEGKEPKLLAQIGGGQSRFIADLLEKVS